MPKHEAIETVVDRIRTDAIGGAADTAKEVIAALKNLVVDSQAESPSTLAQEVDEAVIETLRVMPSLAPPVNAIHRFMGQMEESMSENLSVMELKASLVQAADDFFAWAENALDRVAQYGAEKIQNGDTIFTYSLSSTVWRIFSTAREQSKSFNVIVTESRPANEGHLTVDEMLKEGIPVSVSIDGCIGELVPRCDSVFVGADAVSSHGFALCKVGTYPTALVAKAHGVPFYVAADTLKLDSSTLLGLPWRVDPIHRHEVLDASYPESVQVIGRIFDETPPHLVTAIITEMGLLSPSAVVNAMWKMKLSQRVNEMLPAWSRQEL